MQSDYDLRQLVASRFAYDKDTGVFTWIVNRGAARAGKRAGSAHSEGYLTLCVGYKNMYAHRIAWLLVYGSMPQPGFEIDHIDGNRANNRICNLRIVSRSQNNQNRANMVGVKWNKINRNWRATIAVNGKRHEIGSFCSFVDAARARADAERLYFTHAPTRVTPDHVKSGQAVKWIAATLAVT